MAETRPLTLGRLTGDDRPDFPGTNDEEESWWVGTHTAIIILLLLGMGAAIAAAVLGGVYGQRNVDKNNDILDAIVNATRVLCVKIDDLTGDVFDLDTKLDAIIALINANQVQLVANQEQLLEDNVEIMQCLDEIKQLLTCGNQTAPSPTPLPSAMPSPSACPPIPSPSPCPNCTLVDCIPVFNADLPLTIDVAGTQCYVVQEDLAWSSGDALQFGVTVLGGDIAFDFNGFTMFGDGTSPLFVAGGPATNVRVYDGVMQLDKTLSELSRGLQVFAGARLDVHDFAVHNAYAALLSFDGHLVAHDVVVTSTGPLVGNASCASCASEPIVYGTLFSGGTSRVFNARFAFEVDTDSDVDYFPNQTAFTGALFTRALYADEGEHVWFNVDAAASQPFACSTADECVIRDVHATVNTGFGIGLLAGGAGSGNDVFVHNVTVDICAKCYDSFGVFANRTERVKMADVTVNGPSTALRYCDPPAPGFGAASVYVWAWPSTPGVYDFKLERFALNNTALDGSPVIMEQRSTGAGFPAAPTGVVEFAHGIIYGQPEAYDMFFEQSVTGVRLHNITTLNGFYGIYANNHTQSIHFDCHVFDACVGTFVGVDVANTSLITNVYDGNSEALQLLDPSQVLQLGNSVVNPTPATCLPVPPLPLTNYQRDVLGEPCRPRSGVGGGSINLRWRAMDARPAVVAHGED